MKIPLLLAATLVLSLSLPAFAQTAPAGWKTQARDGGAKTFTPLDLKTGEVYSVTIYDAAPLGGKTPEAYLRAFAGPVGTKVGQLAAPLKMSAKRAEAPSGVGAYNAPNGGILTVAFVGYSPDGTNILVSRTLISSDEVFSRYKEADGELTTAMIRGAIQANDVPPRAAGHLSKVGGDLVPGIYQGEQLDGGKVRFSIRLHIYPNGEFQFDGERNTDFYNQRSGVSSGTGKVAFDTESGQLNVDRDFNMWNDPFYNNYCFYGRDNAGKAAIYSSNIGITSKAQTFLTWVAPLASSASPSVVKAQEDARALAARKKEAAIEAEKNRYKWVVAPGKGVKTAQIEAVWRHFIFEDGPGFGPGQTDVYLLLKDGTIHRDLPVAPDELDIVRSRAKEPKQWGRWKRKGAGYQVSWAGAPFAELEGGPVVPASANQKLNGYWGTAMGMVSFASSFSTKWGITFAANGRFETTTSSVSSARFGYDGSGTVSSSNDNGSSVMGGGPGYIYGGGTIKNNPLADRQGTYSLSGYVLTLRYDNGNIERSPFFFRDKSHKYLWYGNSELSRDHPK